VRGVKFVRTLYERLFSTYPEVQPLFASTNMEMQAQKLYEALEYIAFGYGNRTGGFAVILRRLGQRHKAYGVKPGHYGMMRKVLLETGGVFRTGLDARRGEGMAGSV